MLHCSGGRTSGRRGFFARGLPLRPAGLAAAGCYAILNGQKD
jgi:hypothetical protein